MSKVKYVKVQNNQIIAFGEGLNHKDFKDWNPVSAGFISVGIDKNGNPIATCYGGSDSLGLKADEEDGVLATRQILGQGYWQN